MKNQRTDEWTNYDDHSLSYHTEQWERQKESTLSFYEFIKEKLSCAKSVIDLGAGAGAATSYLALREVNTSFVAADYVEDYLDIGRYLAKKRSLDNLTFRQVDWFNLEKTDEFDGVISLQTLSWLPEARAPLAKAFDCLNPNWLALSSLFYEGDISCTVEVKEHSTNRQSFYNIYSLPDVERIAGEYGYQITKCQKFEISFDIPKPSNLDRMGTYTRSVLAGSKQKERLQISGPLLMPWYMLLFERF